MSTIQTLVKLGADVQAYDRKRRSGRTVMSLNVQIWFSMDCSC